MHTSGGLSSVNWGELAVKCQVYEALTSRS